MKKTKMVAFLVLGTTAIVSAQTAQEVAFKNEIKTVNQKESLVKKEERNEMKSFDKKLEELKNEKRNAKRELQLIEASDINENTKAQFVLDFGNVTNVRWQKTNKLDNAFFLKNNSKTNAFYDLDSKLVGTTINKTFADLPIEAQKIINTTYKEYKKGPIILYNDNEDNNTNMELYNKEFEDEDLYFIELEKSNEKIALMIKPTGDLSFFSKILDN